MKKVTVIIRKREINKLFPPAFQLTIKDEASVIDVIKALDEEIKRKVGIFPIRRYKSLLQMIIVPENGCQTDWEEPIQSNKNRSNLVGGLFFSPVACG